MIRKCLFFLGLGSLLLFMIAIEKWPYVLAFVLACLCMAKYLFFTGVQP